MTNDHSKTVDYDIPVWRKYTLSVQEALSTFESVTRRCVSSLRRIPVPTISSGTAPVRRSSGDFLSSIWMNI